MAKKDIAEPLDLNQVWPAPLICRGYRMGRDEILGRLKQMSRRAAAAVAQAKADTNREDDYDLEHAEAVLAQAEEHATYLAQLIKTVEITTNDLSAQQVLYDSGLPYRSGCGADLREEQHPFISQPRGIVYRYKCSACGASHTCKFPKVLPEARDLCEANELDWNEIDGSGPGGLVTVEDVQAVVDAG